MRGRSYSGFQLCDAQSFALLMCDLPLPCTAGLVVTEPSRSDGYQFEHLPESDAVSAERAQAASLNYMDFYIQKIKLYIHPSQCLQ